MEKLDSFLPQPETSLCGWAPIYLGELYDQTYVYPNT